MKNKRWSLKMAASVCLAVILAASPFAALASSGQGESYTQGLWADYYQGKDFNSYVTGRQESKIDYQWNQGQRPVEGLGSENYSIRWSGRVLAPETGAYQLISNIDDGVKVWLDNELIIQDSGPHYPAQTIGTVTLEQGVYYDLTVDYYNGELGGTAQLSWKTPSGETEIIPAENLYLPDPAEVSLTVEGDSIYAQGLVRSESEELFSLVVERLDQDGKVLEMVETARPDAETMLWETEEMAYEEGSDYRAYVQNTGGDIVSNTAERVYGIDAILNVDHQATAGEVGTLLYGACLEDVNHELYGGIWSQMVYGESFAEPSSSMNIQDFTSYGGSWNTQEEDGVRQIVAGRHDGIGPKLMIEGTQCETGVVSADVWVGEGEGPAGFIVKVTDPRIGADNFNGYEIGLMNNQVRIGAHRYNYAEVGNYACNAPAGTWANLTVEMTRDTLTVYVNDQQVAQYTDPNPLTSGTIGLRAWNCSAKFKNIRFGADRDSMEPIEIPDFDEVKLEVSGMWDGVVRDTAEGEISLTEEQPYKGEHSQRVQFVSGEGAVGVANQGLNRKGMNFEQDKEYEGYFYARSDQPVSAYVVLENKDGTTQYAETEVSVSGSDWKKYAFTITPNAKDAYGRMTLELRSEGTLDIGYVFLQPGEWGRYKGLPVRKDVGEALESQNLSVLRFGGCMANAEGYRWKEMLGDPETRPIYDGWWYDYSSFGFGIVEFLDLCEALGVTAIPDFNAYETPEDMADFIDFATGTDPENEWVQKRIEMGHPEPYSLPYLQFGNEEKVNMDYAQRFNAVAKAIWEKDDDIILVVGDFAYQQPISDPYNFTGADSGITSLEAHKAILDQAIKYDREVWFDVHIWTENQGDCLRYFEACNSLYYQLQNICPGAKVKLPIFELNANAHDMERALENAYAIGYAEQHSDIYPIVCSANCLQVDGHNDNAWDQGLVFMDNDSAWLQAPGYIPQMLRETYQPLLINTTMSPSIANVTYHGVKSEDGKTVAVKIVNRSGKEQTLRLSLDGFTGDENTVTITSLEASSQTQSNPSNNRDNITPQSETIENAIQDNRLDVTLSPYSYTIVTMEALSESPDPEPPASSEESSDESSDSSTEEPGEPVSSEEPSEPGDSDSSEPQEPGESQEPAESEESTPPSDSSEPEEPVSGQDPDRDSSQQGQTGDGAQTGGDAQNPVTGAAGIGGLVAVMLAAGALVVYKSKKE